MREWYFEEETFVELLLHNRQVIGEVLFRGSLNRWVGLTAFSSKNFSSYKQAKAWVERSA